VCQCVLLSTATLCVLLSTATLCVLLSAATLCHHHDRLLCTPACADDKAAEMLVVPVALPLVAAISTLRISVPQDLRPADARRAVLLSLQEVR
jgi:hypothetical protein